ncbi:MAG: phenylalanine--tRNA ligase subunit alpha [Candidatus Thorarchaeota archaeon]|jgi:phenylalanyl-tRNA synthetase alpha chain
MTELQISAGEKAVLYELVEIDRKVLASDLSNRMKEKDERVISILNVLAEKGLVNIDTREIITYSLTDEGIEYANIGLPELRLFRSLEDLGGSSDLDAAVSEAELDSHAKGIAMSWARKNGWIGITKKDGKTILESKETEVTSEVEKVLNLLQEGQKEISSSMSNALDQATQRNLISPITTRIIEAEIKPSKREEISALLSSSIDGVFDLTPEMLLSGDWKEHVFKPFNVEATPPYVNYGKKHPYAEFNDWLKEILIGLGFDEWFGPYVETEFWNNDTLFVPQDHVAREVQDQFGVIYPYTHGDLCDLKHYKAVKAVHENGGDTGSIGWETAFSKEIATRLCLRSHTTPVSMRYLSEYRDSPQKMFTIDRNFRNEKLSARHAQEFNQCEGIIMDKGLTLRDLMGYIREITQRVGIKKIKFKPGQFPFTEPSIECFAKHDTLGWIEVAPGGIFRPEVTYPLGIKDSVLAWGIGSGRMYMATMGIGDIRNLFSRDLNWLRRSFFVR